MSSTVKAGVLLGGGLGRSREVKKDMSHMSPTPSIKINEHHKKVAAAPISYITKLSLCKSSVPASVVPTAAS